MVCIQAAAVLHVSISGTQESAVTVTAADSPTRVHEEDLEPHEEEQGPAVVVVQVLSTEVVAELQWITAPGVPPLFQVQVNLCFVLGNNNIMLLHLHQANTPNIYIGSRCLSI